MNCKRCYKNPSKRVHKIAQAISRLQQISNVIVKAILTALKYQEKARLHLSATGERKELYISVRQCWLSFYKGNYFICQ